MRGYIYFFQAVGENLFKIGRTSRSPQSRRRGLDTGCPFDLELLGVLQTVDIVEAEHIVHEYLKEHRVSPRKEWFRVEKEVIVEVMERFGAMYDVALGNRDYRVIEGKYLVLRCEIAKDNICVTTEKCPFCGKKHSHGTGGIDYLEHVENIEGINTLGHRVAHCLERPIELILPNGTKVNNQDGYYLRVII